VRSYAQQVFCLYTEFVSSQRCQCLTFVLFFGDHPVKKLSIFILIATVIFSPLGLSNAWAAVDVEAAQAFMKKEKCTKCHSVDKKKSGPSLKSIAAEFKGKPDAEAKLATHIITGPMVEVDGEKEAHAKPKSSDQAEIKNLVQYILSQ
jgi:cytochrome c